LVAAAVKVTLVIIQPLRQQEGLAEVVLALGLLEQPQLVLLVLPIKEIQEEEVDGVPEMAVPAAAVVQNRPESIMTLDILVTHFLLAQTVELANCIRF
jgi:hypothetical protein